MQRIHSRIVGSLLVAVLLVGCIEFHRRTIREYGTEKVDERIEAEIKKEKPESGYDTWQNYWRWWYSVLRRKKKPPFKSDEFKSSADLVNYIKEKRRAKGLPTYED